MKKVIIIVVLFCLSLICNSQEKISDDNSSIDLILKATYVPINSRTDLSIKVDVASGYFYSAAPGRISSVLINGVEVVTENNGNAIYSVEDYKTQLMDFLEFSHMTPYPDLILVSPNPDEVTTLIIDHEGGFQTRYIGTFTCFSSLEVVAEDWIGTVIDTPVSPEISRQITFELWKDGRMIDPTPYINKSKSNMKRGVGVSIKIDSELNIYDSLHVVNLDNLTAFINGVPMSVEGAISEINTIANKYGPLNGVYVYPDKCISMEYFDAFMDKLTGFNPISIDFPELPLFTRYVDSQNENSIRIKMNSHDRILFRNTPIHYSLTAEYLDESIKSKYSYYDILLYNDGKASYEAYVELLKQIIDFYRSKRDQESLSIYGKYYFNLTSSEKKEINQIIPLNIYRLRNAANAH